MRGKLQKAVIVLTAIVGALALIAGGLALWARHVTTRSYADAPRPPIVADTSPSGVARGEMLFQSLCMECHGGPDGRATGKRLDEVPAFLGRFYSANLAHPQHGVAQRSDADLARVLRLGVLPDGRLSAAMSSFGKLGDNDVAALIGFMRSGADIFEPAGALQPHTELTLVGSMIVTYISGLPKHEPVKGVPVPAKSPSVEYGRYMAQALDCVGCHTQGFGSNKMEHSEAFAGGFELTDPTGAKIFTKNITMDKATGIGRWSVDEFNRAVTRGVTPQGYLVRKPMPLFSRLDAIDIEAIYKFLQTMPSIHRPNTPGGHILQKPRAQDTPEVLFANIGCASCHGDNAPHREKIRAATTKSDGEVATWILNPQAVKPGSSMPSFENILSRTQAEDLARYIKRLAKKRGG